MHYYKSIDQHVKTKQKLVVIIFLQKVSDIRIVIKTEIKTGNLITIILVIFRNIKSICY